MAYHVPFIDPRSHYAKLKPEIDRAIIECLANGDLVNRHQLKDFEQHLAEFVGAKYAVGVNSGYHALYFALLGAGVGRGDEVITVAHTFVATVSADRARDHAADEGPPAGAPQWACVRDGQDFGAG